MWLQKPPLGTPLNWENPLNDGCVMHLAMNEGHGDKVQDLSMNGNHGTLSGFAYPPTVDSGWNPGYKGVGLNFEGDNLSWTHVDCGNSPSLNHTDLFTVSAIVKFSDLSLRSYLMSKGEFSVDGWYWRVIEDGSWSVVYNWAGGSDITDSGIDLPTGEWLYLVTVLNNVTPRVDFYVNGDWRAYTTPSQPFLVNPNRTLFVGINNNIRPHNGSIDQPRILDRAYTAKEAKDYSMNPWGVYLDE